MMSTKVIMSLTVSAADMSTSTTAEIMAYIQGLSIQGLRGKSDVFYISGV
jgi:hypothetical protein